MREVIGNKVPLAADHFGHIGVNCCIRLGQAMESTTSRGWRTWCRGSTPS